MSEDPDRFTRHELPDGCEFFTGGLPAELSLSEVEFADLWAIHPPHPGTIRRFGRVIPVKRYQQAYGTGYAFSGCMNGALPVPALLRPLLGWVTDRVDSRLNGIFVNWYDGSLRHQIGPHSDEDKDLVPGAPIVMVSFGAERTFRLSRSTKDARYRKEFKAAAGTVFLLPYATNLSWKHAVPHFATSTGNRVSVTFRSFRQESLVAPDSQ